MPDNPRLPQSRAPLLLNREEPVEVIWTWLKFVQFKVLNPSLLNNMSTRQTTGIHQQISALTASLCGTLQHSYRQEILWNLMTTHSRRKLHKVRETIPDKQLQQVLCFQWHGGHVQLYQPLVTTWHVPEGILGISVCNVSGVKAVFTPSSGVHLNLHLWS